MLPVIVQPQRGHSVELPAQLVPQFEQVEHEQPVAVAPVTLPFAEQLPLQVGLPPV